MSNPKFDIFISYKRKSLAMANNLYYRLTIRGYSTFFDLDEMRKDDFDVQIYEYIKGANDIIVIIESGSFDACKDYKTNKDCWRDDWYCEEIAYALKEGKNIIPILLNGFEMPNEDFFPDELKGLSKKNAPEFSYSFFDEYITKLINKGYITSVAYVHNKATSVFKFYSIYDCEIWKEGKIVCSLIGNSKEPFYLLVERSGEFVFQCLRKCGQNESMLQLQLGIAPNSEKVVNLPWESQSRLLTIILFLRKYCKIIIGLLSIITIVILLQWPPKPIVPEPNQPKRLKNGECVAHISLMNYDLLNIHYDNAFSILNNSIFKYDDSIDNQGFLHIYPTSRVLTLEDGSTKIRICNLTDSLPYHFPFIAFTLINKMRTQFVFIDAYLIISDFHFDDTPIYRISIDNGLLTIVNETQLLAECNLKYSILQEGESYVNFKNINDSIRFSQEFSEIVGTGVFIGLLNNQYEINSNFYEEIPVGSANNLDNLRIKSVVIDKDAEYQLTHINDIKQDEIVSIDRTLIANEHDNAMYIVLKSKKSCSFWLRGKFITSHKDTLYTKPVHIKINIPRTGYICPNM